MNWRKRLRADIMQQHTSVFAFCGKTTIAYDSLNQTLIGNSKLSLKMAFQLEEYYIRTARFWLQAQLDAELEDCVAVG